MKYIWNAILCWSNEERKKGRNNVYKIINKEIFQMLENDQDICLVFICHFVYKLIENSEIPFLMIDIKKSIDKKNSKKIINDSVISWIRKNSERDKDAPQISKKIINPLYYLYELIKYSGNKLANKFSLEQSINDLSYFRIHRRDKNKIPGLTRKENKNFKNNKNFNLIEAKQKNLIRKWNKEFYRLDINNRIYVSEKSIKETNCHNVHHIWPLSYFEENSLKKIDPNIQENLILLTADEHLGFAHKDGNTSLLNLKNIKEILLIQKKKIEEYSAQGIGEYSKKRFYKFLCTIFHVEPENLDERINFIDDYINDIILNFSFEKDIDDKNN